MEKKMRGKNPFAAYFKKKASLVMTVVIILSGISIVLLPFPYNVITAALLIVLGIMALLLLKNFLPVFFMISEFNKVDWKVKVDPKKEKSQDEYDVIVAGAGVGGLTCAALLAKRGYKVLLAERLRKVGGYCNSFVREGFSFNSGTLNVVGIHRNQSGLDQNGNIDILLKEFGFSEKEYFLKNTPVKFKFKGKEIVIPESIEEFEALLGRMFPGEKEGLRGFINYIIETTKGRDRQRNYREYGSFLPMELIVKIYGIPALIPIMRDFKKTGKAFNESYRQVLDRYFKNEELKEFLSYFVRFMGVKAEGARFITACFAAYSYFVYGGYYLKAQKFADSLKDVFEKYGGKVLQGKEVDRILVKGGSVEGIEVGGKTYKSSIVVSNVNARTTFLELVGEKNLKVGFSEYIKRIKFSPSNFLVFLGVDSDLSMYPTVYKDMDQGLEIYIISNVDKDTAPEGKSSVIILEDPEFSYDQYPERGTKEYEEKKEAKKLELIRKAEKIIPGLGSMVEVSDAATPKTLERYTGVPKGATYIFDHSIGVRRPDFKTPIKGLYLAGASVNPGGGIPTASVSGRICANDICDWKLKLPQYHLKDLAFKKSS